MRLLAHRIAHFIADYDHYGFVDALETGESIEDGMERASDEAYSVMLGGGFDLLREWVYDPDFEGPAGLKREMDSIISELKRLEGLRGKTISKNPLKIKRRKKKCN